MLRPVYFPKFVNFFVLLAVSAQNPPAQTAGLRCEHAPLNGGVHKQESLRVSAGQWGVVRQVLLNKGDVDGLVGFISSKGIDIVSFYPIEKNTWDKTVVHESLEEFKASIRSLKHPPVDYSWDNYSLGAYALLEIAGSLHLNKGRKGAEKAHGSFWSIDIPYNDGVPPIEHSVHFVCEGGQLKISKIRVYRNNNA